MIMLCIETGKSKRKSKYKIKLHFDGVIIDKKWFEDTYSHVEISQYHLLTKCLKNYQLLKLVCMKFLCYLINFWLASLPYIL